MDDLFQLVAGGARLSGRPPPDAARHGGLPGFLAAFEAAGMGASAAARAAPDAIPDPTLDAAFERGSAAPTAAIVQVPVSPPVAVAGGGRRGALPGTAGAQSRIGAAFSEGASGDTAVAMLGAVALPVAPADALSPDGRPAEVQTGAPGGAVTDPPEEGPVTGPEPVAHLAVPMTLTPGSAEPGGDPSPIPLAGVGGAIRAGAEVAQGARPRGAAVAGPMVLAGSGVPSVPVRGLPQGLPKGDADAAPVAVAPTSPKVAKVAEGVAQAPLAPPQGPVAGHAAIAPGGAGPDADGPPATTVGGASALAMPSPIAGAVPVARNGMIVAAAPGAAAAPSDLPAGPPGPTLPDMGFQPPITAPQAHAGPRIGADRPASPPADAPPPLPNAALQVTGIGQPDPAAPRDAGSGKGGGPHLVLPQLPGLSITPAAQPDIRPMAEPTAPVTVAAPVAGGPGVQLVASGSVPGLVPPPASAVNGSAVGAVPPLLQGEAPRGMGPTEGLRAAHDARATPADAPAGAAPVAALGPTSVPPGEGAPRRPILPVEGTPLPDPAGAAALPGRQPFGPVSGPMPGQASGPNSGPVSGPKSAPISAPPPSPLPAKGAAPAILPGDGAPLVGGEGGSPFAPAPTAEPRGAVAVMPPPGPAHAMPGTAVAQGMARQLSQALAERQGAEGVLEIALDPLELGRVRLSFAEAGGALTLAITADRPETAELMRRHLQLLTQEFQRAGLDAPSVDISDRHGGTRQEGRQDAPGAPTRDQPGGTAADPGPAPGPVPARRQPQDGSGLDLRL
ncbi:MAG: flagellar hook-length control protein FliK [Roseicyclus sp.]|nr:flagellar hook-length control protein FliK [Roseicyclus sp.]